MIEQIEESLQKLEDGEYIEAIQQLKQQLQHQDIPAELKFEVAEHLYEKGYIEEALTIMEELVHTYKNEYELSILYAEMLMEVGNEDDALAQLHHIIEALQSQKEAHEMGKDETLSDMLLRAILLSTEIYIMQGLYEVAEYKVKQAIEQFPEEKVLYSALGEIYYYQEKYALAVTSYQRGNLYASYAKIADCYAHLGKYEESLTYYNKAVEEHDNVDVLWGHAMVLSQLKNWQEAKGRLVRLLSIDPYYSSAYPLLVDIYKELGELDQAMNTAEEGLSYDQTNPFMYYILGELYQSKQLQTEAIQSYKQALALDDQYVPALEKLSQMLLDNEEWQESIKYLEALLDITPENGTIHLQLGEAYEGLEEWKLAEQSYREAIGVDADNIEAINQLAFLLRDEGRLEEAIILWETSLTKNPDQEDIEQILRDYE